MNSKQQSVRLSAQKGMRTTITAMLINALLAVIKGVAGILGHSTALIADAVESTADVASSLVVFGGLKIASSPPDADHPYGHGKAEPLAGMAVALMLIAAAIGIATQSIRGLATPSSPPASFTLIVLIVVIITKELLYRFVFSVGCEIDSTAVKSDAWHHRSDALTSAAAFVGISIAVIGGERYERADDLAALFASGIIAVNGYRLLRPAIAEIMDAAPPVQVEAQIRKVAGRVEGVVHLEKCFIRKMGFDYFVDIHVVVDENLSVRMGHEIAHKVKSALLEANLHISDVSVHIEPTRKLQSSQP